MPLYLRTVLAAVTELLVLFILGGIAPFGNADGEHSLSETLAGGFLIYCAALELTALPLTLAAVPLYDIFFIWAVLLSLLCSVSVVLRLKGFFREAGAYGRRFRFTLAEFLMLGCGLILLAFSLLYDPGIDKSGLISQMMTDISHDSPGYFEALYGDPLTSYPTGSLLARWHLGGEFYAVLFDIPCLVQMKLVQQGITVVLSLMITHRIFFRLTGKKRIPAAAATMIVMLALFTTRTPWSSAGLLIENGWTGNAQAAAVLVPLAILLLIALEDNPGRGELYVLGMCLGIAAVSLSVSAAFLIPIAIGTGMVPVVIAKREPEIALHAILWMLIPLMAGLLSVTHPFLPLAS